MQPTGAIEPSDSKRHKAVYVEAMFTRIARWYDLLNTILSLGLHYGWRRQAAALCRLQPGDRAVDVCTGTGDFAFELARVVGPTGNVVGVDFSSGMLSVGRRKVKERGLEDQITLELGDAENLPLPDNAFDAATVAFGGRNVTHLDRLFAEMARVVRPGGRVVFLELSRPHVWGLRHLYRFYFWRLAPIVGKFVSGDQSAYTYLPNSLNNFPVAEEVARLMREAGLIEVEYYPLTGGIVTIHAGTVSPT